MEDNPYQTSRVILNEKGKGNSGFAKIVKRILIGFGVIFSLLIILLIILFIFIDISTSNTYSDFENISEPFIKDFLASQSPWNYEKAKPQLSDHWLEVTTDEDNEKLFTYFNKLGSFNNVDSISTQGCLNFKGTDGTIERCNYMVNANYENGKAVIYFGLSLEDEELKLMQLHVDSDAFIQ